MTGPRSLISTQAAHRAHRREITGSVTRPADWDREYMLHLIVRAAETVGEPLTFARFETWAAEQQLATPAEATWATRFGSWSQACAEAGVSCGRGSGPRVTRATQDEAVCRLAIGDFVAECAADGTEPTLTAYEAMSQQRGWPTRKTITKRLGTPWSSVIAAVASTDT